jgi:hypothetical protein
MDSIVYFYVLCHVVVVLRPFTLILHRCLVFKLRVIIFFILSNRIIQNMLNILLLILYSINT